MGSLGLFISLKPAFYILLVLIPVFHWLLIGFKSVAPSYTVTDPK